MGSGAKNIIAFMGVAGANADLACREAYPYMETLPCPGFDDVFEAVESGKAELGLIPVENSQAGRVAEIHNILPHTKLHIVGEYFQKIEHQLVGVKGAKLEEVKVAYSHPQALMQCRENLRKLKIKGESYSNTAAAAKDVAAWGDKSKAAISSKLAAELYGLDILKPNIEDSDTNTTVFAAVSLHPGDPDPEKGAILTSLLFTIRNIPAALYKSLGGFATNNVNLLKIESYIPGGNSGSAAFSVTFEGHPSERAVQLALEELGFFCKNVRVLGVYYAAKERQLLAKGN